MRSYHICCQSTSGRMRCSAPCLIHSGILTHGMFVLCLFVVEGTGNQIQSSVYTKQALYHSAKSYSINLFNIALSGWTEHIFLEAQGISTLYGYCNVRIL